MTAEEAAEYFGPTTGLHANRGETSAVMAIDPALRRHRRGERRDAAVPRGHQPGRRSTPRSSSRRRARSIARPQSGTWGDARESTPEYGERYLEVVTEATIRMLDDIERTFGGDAAALRRSARLAREPGPAAHHAADGEVGVELDEVGPLADRDPAAIGDAEQREGIAARGGDRGRQRDPGRDEVPDRAVEAITEPASVVVPASVTRVARRPRRRAPPIRPRPSPVPAIGERVADEDAVGRPA